MDKLRDRVVLVGVGGATCSGKTTLAKHLRNILPNSIIIHQDDFAPPEELIPIHPKYDVADWDAPDGAIDWPRFRAFLRSVKENGKIPPDHKSHDHMNEQKDIPISNALYQALKTRFQAFEDEQRQAGIRVVWGLVDGFLLYWDKEVIDTLDVRFFLRVPHDILKQRRHERHGYHTAGKRAIVVAPETPGESFPSPMFSPMPRLFLNHSRNTHVRFGVQFNPEGSLWRDPPMYWEQIVYPAYVMAHAEMFEDGDVENGKPTGERVPGLVVIEPVRKGAELSMDDIVRDRCEELWNFLHA